MQARKLGSAWDAYAPAKLNLYLEILGRRSDGFHELETLMASVRLYDYVRWSPGEGDSDFRFCVYNNLVEAHISAPPPSDETNLAVRAARCLATEAGVEPHGRLELWKRIPAEAGLGGGSSDAAAALTVLNAAWNIDYPAERLLQLAAKLGSDVPFFLRGGYAVGRGRGEALESLPAMPQLHAVIVKPPAGVSTTAAYAQLNVGPVSQQRRIDSRERLNNLTSRLRRAALGSAGSAMSNRLLGPACTLNPQIERIKAAFTSLACPAHGMTGSGSAYFGLLESARRALWFAKTVSALELGAVYAAATCR